MMTKKSPKFFPANRTPEFWVTKKERMLTPQEQVMLRGMEQELNFSLINITRIQGELQDKETDCDLFRQEMKMSPRLKRVQLQRGLEKREKHIAGLKKIFASWKRKFHDVSEAIRALKKFGMQ